MSSVCQHCVKKGPGCSYEPERCLLEPSDLDNEGLYTLYKECNGELWPSTICMDLNFRFFKNKEKPK